MDNYSALYQRWLTYTNADKEYNRIQFKASLSFQEREEYLIARDEALEELSEILDIIKVGEILEVSSAQQEKMLIEMFVKLREVLEVSPPKQAKKLIEMLSDFFVELDRIQISADIGNSTRTKITSQLQRAGFVLEGGEIIRFPGE